MVDGTRSLRRVRYFDGQLLTAADLQAEQDYYRERLRRHNLLFHGWGVASGLDVEVDGGSVVVSPGLAIDPVGEELVVGAPLCSPPPPAGPVSYVVLRREERPVEPIATTSDDGEGVRYARVEESAGLTFALDERCRDGVVLARLRAGARGWSRDRRYRPRRLGV